MFPIGQHRALMATRHMRRRGFCKHLMVHWRIAILLLGRVGHVARRPISSNGLSVHGWGQGRVAPLRSLPSAIRYAILTRHLLLLVLLLLLILGLRFSPLRTLRWIGGVDPVNLDVLRGEPLAARLSIDLQMIGIFTHFAGLASLAIAPDSSHHLLRLLLMEDI